MKRNKQRERTSGFPDRTILSDCNEFNGNQKRKECYARQHFKWVKDFKLQNIVPNKTSSWTSAPGLLLLFVDITFNRHEDIHVNNRNFSSESVLMYF